MLTELMPSNTEHARVPFHASVNNPDLVQDDIDRMFG